MDKDVDSLDDRIGRMARRDERIVIVPINRQRLKCAQSLIRSRHVAPTVLIALDMALAAASLLFCTTFLFSFFSFLYAFTLIFFLFHFYKH